ncbi:unnamed protein product [Cylindrotheca closterium]|uniref:Transmembrane protein n=1 Tax=Cylindrotheca closterium TaxID=2856 RepID=A0AAD2CUD2_9STRA|nr:unnamed protein product [Cylindrotheca closterium]
MPLIVAAITHALLILSLKGNLLMACAFPSSKLLSLGLLQSNPIVRSTSNCFDPPSKIRNFELSSFISDGAMEQDLLSYLPKRGQAVPPDFLQLIRGATTRYSNPSSFAKGESLCGITHIMDVIDFEYKVSPNPPIAIRNVTYTNQRILTKLLSVCLFHQLPAPIVCEVLKEYDVRNEKSSNNNDVTNVEEEDCFRTCLQALKEDGWRAIAFPEGMRVQVRPGQVCSAWKDDLPSRKVTPEMAVALLEKAHVANNPPPPTSLPSDTDTSTRQTDTPIKKYKLVGPSFPRDRVTLASKIKTRITTILSKVRSKTQKLTEKLNQAGRAGFLAYGFLNFALYAGGTLLQWHHISISGPPTISSQLQKLGKALGTVYVGSQVTKLPRIALAVALAPVGNRSLDWLHEKLGVSEGTAFGILTAALIGSFLAVVGILIVGSALLE